MPLSVLSQKANAMDELFESKSGVDQGLARHAFEVVEIGVRVQEAGQTLFFRVGQPCAACLQNALDFKAQADAGHEMNVVLTVRDACDGNGRRRTKLLRQIAQLNDQADDKEHVGQYRQ